MVHNLDDIIHGRLKDNGLLGKLAFHFIIIRLKISLKNGIKMQNTEYF